MNIQDTTVTIEQLANGNAIRMTWQRQVNAQDVERAFTAITDILKEASSPMYVVVDLLSNPNFPIGATLNAALFGPYRNPKLKEWLIIGSNSMAQFIERTLASVTGHRNVRWFKTQEEVSAYLNKQ